MNCPGCLLKFNNELHVPYLLPKCGHLLCKLCIEERSKIGKDSCPKCFQINYQLNKSNSNTKNHRLDISDDNSSSILITSLREVKLLQEIEQISLQTTDNVPKKKKNPKSCIEPIKKKSSYSIGHSSSHSNFDDKEDISNEFNFCNESKFFLPGNSYCQTDNDVEKEEQCPKHNRSLEAYCFKSAKFLCLNCIIENRHTNKDVLEIEDAFLRANFELNQEISKLYHEKMSKYKQIAQKTEETKNYLLENFKYASKKVELFFAEITNLIQQTKQDIIQDLSLNNKKTNQFNRRRFKTFTK